MFRSNGPISFIGGLCSNFVGCQSFPESKSPDIFASGEKMLDGSFDFLNFSVKCYFLLISRDSVTRELGFAGYLKDLSLKNIEDSIIRCPTSFSSTLSITFPILMHRF